MRNAKNKSREAKTTDATSNVIDAQLERYRSMRDFGITTEPSGSGKIDPGNKSGTSTKISPLPFCIQKHAASHLHYDLRLGWNGVLKSWAIAKGPSYNTADKRLAIQVEDHPIEYGGFEGIIPVGQYGGGTVMLWDQGTWEPQKGHTDVDAGLKSGSLKFILNGTKMHGKWILVRVDSEGASKRKPNWLLIKEHDDFERSNGVAITDEQPNSVITDRSLDTIADNEDHVWNSKDPTEGKAWYRQKSKPSPARLKQTAKASAASTPDTGDKGANRRIASLQDLPNESQPSFIEPQLALHAEQAPEGVNWVHELKLDGYRIQARKDQGEAKLLTRTGLDWTSRIPSIADAILHLPAENATIDGEVVVLAANGTTSFADLQASFQDGANIALTYFCFDLLHLDGHNTRHLPLLKRKALLENLLRSSDPSTIRFNEHIQTSGKEMFRHACALHAEGILSKRSDAKYTSGRSSGWLKFKCLHEQEFVIGGFTLLSNGIHGIGALLLGYYEDDKLIYAGRAGTGFTQKTHRSLRYALESLARSKSPFVSVPTEARLGVHWVRPSLVAQVRFATWTAEKQLRQAAFLGLREDKSPKEIIREESAPSPRSPRTRSASHRIAPATRAAKTAPAHVHLTHPEKILDTESGMTKQALAEYYWAIAEYILPYIADRPISLVRCPDGSAKPCFYQKHVTSMLPKNIGTVMVPDKKTGKPEPYITLNTREALTGLAQMGVLEIHPWSAKNKDLEHADRIVFDLDPDESLPWARVSEAALDVRARLKRLQLEGFLKTTGGKGLHIVVPIRPTRDWAEIKSFARNFVLDMEKSSPSLYLSKMTKAARAGKIYLDYLRNERGATSVAPYSSRARAGAPVSMPISWSELHSTVRPRFHVSDFLEWQSRLKKDPWNTFLSSTQELP